MNGVVNTVKAGSSILIKFSLAGDMGLDIFAGSGPTSIGAADFQNLRTDAIEEVVILTAGKL